MATRPRGSLPRQAPPNPSPATTNATAINTVFSDSFAFDNGDIKILLKGSDGVEFIGNVSSHAMSLASPVWKKFIFPPFGLTAPPAQAIQQKGATEERGNICQQPVKQIDFREDDPEALRILLRIAHLKFRDIPSRLPYRTLLSMAILCDQYDCVDLVVSFLPQWLADEEVESKKPGQVNWLFIAWVFGRRKVFEKLTKHLVRSLYIVDEDEYYASNQRIEEPLPAGILDNILEVRNDTLVSLLGICYTKTYFYEDRQGTQCLLGCDPCDALAYGSLVLALQHVGLWPRKEASKILCTIESLAENISGLSLYTWSNGWEDHEGCSATSFSGDVRDILGQMRDPVSQAHYEHMDKVNKL